jgi:DNA invertase Pin-like site-specific DNA recombinase
VSEPGLRDVFGTIGDMTAAPARTATALPHPHNRIRVGYARVSTREQDHDSQLDDLTAAHCREIIIETASTRSESPKLRAALASLRPGDTLVIHRPDRVARSMKELLVFLEDELHARDITLEILTGICAGVHRPGGATLADRLLFAVAALAAEMERELIRDRTRDGLRAAAAAGRHGGRPATVTHDILAIARARQARGESVTAIARHLGVGRSTLYRALQNPDRPEPPAPDSSPPRARAPRHDHTEATA